MVRAGGAVLAVGIIYLLRLNSAAGLMVDDAWYILLARALSEGRGYRLISSAVEEILPSYPPGFPAILSLVFRLMPAFPDNVWMLKAVSIFAMVGVGLLTFSYMSRHRRFPESLSLYVAIAVTLTPAFVFLATSTVMSECVFTFVLLLTVVLLHRSVESVDPRRARVWAIMAGVSATATVLVRSAGVAVVLAGILWLLMERLWRRSALFAVTVAFGLMPWMLYTQAHAPTPAQRARHGGAVAYGYVDQLSMRWAGSPSFGRATLADLPARIATNIVDIAARDIAGIIVPVVFRGATESGEEIVALGGRAGLGAGSMGGAIETMVLSVFLSSIVCTGFVRKIRERVTVAELLVPIAIAMTLLWPFWSFRFVLPLAPFIYLYLTAGIQMIARNSDRAVRIALMCLIGLNVFDHVGYVLLAKEPVRPSRIEWLAHADHVDAALQWMGHHLEHEGALATTNPALVFLRTGRKSIAFDDPAVNWDGLVRQGVRYVASFIPVNLPDRAHASYKVRYRAGSVWIIELQ